MSKAFPTSSTKVDAEILEEIGMLFFKNCFTFLFYVLLLSSGNFEMHQEWQFPPLLLMENS